MQEPPNTHANAIWFAWSDCLPWRCTGLTNDVANVLAARAKPAVNNHDKTGNMVFKVFMVKWIGCTGLVWFVQFVWFVWFVVRDLWDDSLRVQQTKPCQPCIHNCFGLKTCTMLHFVDFA